MQIHLVFFSVITARGIPSTEYLNKSNRSGHSLHSSPFRFLSGKRESREGSGTEVSSLFSRMYLILYRLEIFHSRLNRLEAFALSHFYSNSQCLGMCIN